MSQSRETRPWALVWVALGAGLWGTDTVLRRPLTAHLSSAQIVLGEHLVLSAVLLPVLWRSRREWGNLRGHQWGAVLGIAWGGSALATVCFTEAIRLGHPTGAVFLQKLQPLFTALLAALLLGEPLGRRFWWCLSAGMIGGYLVSFGDQPVVSEIAPERISAALLAVAAAALWGASTVFGRFVLDSVSFLSLTALRIVAATPLLVALAALGPSPFETSISGEQARSLVMMALIPGLAALAIYYRGLRHTRASMAALAELSFPATAALLNWIFLDARVSALQLGGFVVVWSVILFLERTARARAGNV